MSVAQARVLMKKAMTRRIHRSRAPSASIPPMPLATSGPASERAPTQASKQVPAAVFPPETRTPLRRTPVPTLLAAKTQIERRP